QAVGVIGRLNGRLRLRTAVAHGVERRVGVAFYLDGTTVLHGHVHAALVLAACAAARAHHLHLGGCRSGLRRFGKGLVWRRRKPCGCADGGCKLRKASPRQERFRHSSSSSLLLKARRCNVDRSASGAIIGGPTWCPPRAFLTVFGDARLKGNP